MSTPPRVTFDVSTQSILLIDQNPEDDRLIKEELAILENRSFRIETVSTLKAAFQRIQKGGISVILLDLVLPDSKGLTSFLRLHFKAGDVPIIVLIDIADRELGAATVEKGAVDYLVKQEVVSNLLEKSLRFATERTHTLKALKASEAKFRELYENVIAGVFQTTADGKFLSANPALVEMLGYDTDDELLGLDIVNDIYMYPEDRDNWKTATEQAGEIRNAELILKRKDGRKIVVLENSRAVRDKSGVTLYYEGTVTDITEAYELSQQLSYEASHDSLTGLINRREFEIRLQRALENAQATNSIHAVCYMDLDQFKVINDTCGHIAGDELLRQLGQLLQEHLRSRDTLGRLGGDEFGVLLENCDADNAERIAEGLLKAIENYQFIWGTKKFSIGASIGLVPVSNNYRRISEVLRDADAACYVAKDKGRGRVHRYQIDDSMIAQRHGEMQWVTRTKRALEEDRFKLLAQSIVPLDPLKRGTKHVELLVRMIDRHGLTIPPGAFLPAVERYNLAGRLDRWVIDKAFTWFASHPETLHYVSRCFINLSGETVADDDFRVFVIDKLRQTGMPAHKVCFEFTETTAISNLTRANRLIDQLKTEGCEFALDDFGTGVSSFAYLKALGVDYLKIDGLFVGNTATDPIDFAMVKSINEIGHAMGKLTIAEAVESEAVMDKLREIGIDFAQGFVLDHPKPLHQIIPEKLASSS